MLNQRALCRLLSSENLKSRTTIGHSFGDSVKNANVKRWRTSLSPSPRTIAVDAGVYRQPAGMHPLIPQRNIKVLANLVLDFEAGLLGEGLIELFLGVAQRKLLQRIRRRIGAARREVHEICSESSWERNARTGHQIWIAHPHCARRAESDQVLAGILELRQERLIHVTEFRSTHPAHQNVTVDKRSVK